MATGGGKTTVMGMLIAWSILNKVNDRGNARFSDVVLVVCPNITIKNRLQELDPALGEASIYRTRDLVPPHLMPRLTQGRVLVTNWHVFERHEVQSGGASAKVTKAGVPVTVREKIHIGNKTTTSRGYRYLTPDDYHKQVNAGMLTVLEEEHEKAGSLKSVLVESVRYVESDAAWINRILGREVGGKQNILVINDEAHHAYRIRKRQTAMRTKKRTWTRTCRRRRCGSTAWTASTERGASTSAWTCPRRRTTSAAWDRTPISRSLGW